jgi:hypothetical protein
MGRLESRLGVVEEALVDELMLEVHGRGGDTGHA